MSIHEKILETVAFIRTRKTARPMMGFILGSGLGPYADTFRHRIEIPYRDLPNFPQSTVLGHAGKLILGEAEGVPAVALQGRVHYYEGYSIEQVVFPARVLCALGIRQLVVTNAAGGINVSFQAGDLMLITDHINLMGTNPLVGLNVEELGARFPDMSNAYDPQMRAAALKAAEELGISLRLGVYIGVTGPSYETPAEIRAFRQMGADAVGMSTVPEVIAAAHMGIKVLGISCITNMAAGILPQRLTHQEVMDTTTRVQADFIALLRGTVPQLSAVAGS